MKNEPYEYQFSVKPHFTRINSMSGGQWLTGVVFTEHGAVYVYTQGGKSTRPSTTLSLLRGDKVIIRQIPKRYSKRGLVTLAKRFAKEFQG